MVVVTKRTAVPVKGDARQVGQEPDVTVAELTITRRRGAGGQRRVRPHLELRLQLEDLTPTLVRRWQLPNDAAGAVVTGLSRAVRPAGSGDRGRP